MRPGQPHITPNTRQEDSKLSVWVVVAVVAMGETRRKETKRISNRVRGVRHASDDSRVNWGTIVVNLPLPVVTEA